MMQYGVCEFCPAVQRKKLMPFGNRESAEILVVLPNFSPLTAEQEKELSTLYPEALFVFFVACSGLEDPVAAEVPCSVLLRGVSRPFDKVLISDLPVLREMFRVTEGIFIRPDGVKVGVFKGPVSSKNFEEEFGRLKNG
jgi:hypothetical protein